jgi:hypothetical protein
MCCTFQGCRECTLNCLQILDAGLGSVREGGDQQSNQTIILIYGFCPSESCRDTPDIIVQEHLFLSTTQNNVVIYRNM